MARPYPLGQVRLGGQARSGLQATGASPRSRTAVCDKTATVQH